MKVHAQNEIIKLFIEPCHVCGKVCKNITLANYYQLCIDYESNMHILKVLKKKSKHLSHQLQLKAYNILLHLKFKVNFYTP